MCQETVFRTKTSIMCVKHFCPRPGTDEHLTKALCVGGDTLPETNSSPLKIGQNPKGKHLPTINFQVRKAVSFREGTWRIIPLSKWLVTPIYKPFRPFGRGTTLLGGLTNQGY